jgi:4-carboxymuconolactone decarboxylase
MSAEKQSGSNSAMFDEGLKVRRAVVGDAYVNRALENGSSEFAFPGQQLVSSDSSSNSYKSS